MNNQPQKPLEILLKEFKDNLYNATNSSQLALPMIKLIVKEFSQEIITFCENDEKRVVEKYNQELNEFYQKQAQEQQNNIPTMEAEVVQ